MMRSKATLCLASLATLLLLFVMLFPRRHLGQIDLGNPELEASVFALCMLLWLVARAGRWRSDPISFSAPMFGRRCPDVRSQYRDGRRGVRHRRRHTSGG